VEDLDARAAKAQQAREQRTRLQQELAALPALDAAAVEALQAAEQAVARAEARLAGMATGLEILAADVPVRLGDEALTPGETRIVSESVEIQIGEGTRLRLRPGGGTGLEDARRSREQTHQQLRQQLTRCAVASVAEAGNLLRRRETLQGALREIDSELRGLGADKVEVALAQARQALVAANAECERRATTLAGLDAKATDATDPRTALDQAERAEAAARADQEIAQRRWREAEQQTETLAETLRTAETEINDLESRLRLQLEELGDDAARAQALATAEQTRRMAEAMLQERRAALAKLAPEDLAADRQRLDRSLRQQQDKRDDALRQQADSAGRLRADGGSDPVAALKTAQARLDAARARHDGLARRAAAQRRLHDLFTEERQALSDQLTRPLAERVTGYLQRVFGPGASLSLRLEDGTFTGLALGRGAQGATGFDQLSGGAREQVAAAFRLAMAEILAEAHDGCLPLVFDDAFAHSDPERVQKLLRMLDLAASRGLQVIVLTCTPADYAGLGAREIRLG
jgi:DNA repair exonuclease SbcCD ATPase subunit